jgi:hypothetical protein
MLRNIRRLLTLAGVLTSVLLTANVTHAQPPEPPAKRLRNPAVVRSTIGGESHDSYVIRASKGKTITVKLSWRQEEENHAQFTVSDMPGFFGAEPVAFGKEAEDGKRWTGKIPKTANYYIYVVAHPIARYTLRVTVK